MLTKVQAEFRALADAKKALLAQRFFKTGPGEYGAGDKFLGISVPTTRSFLPKTDALPLTELRSLLSSQWHEERLLALLCLVRRFNKAKQNQAQQSLIVDLYLANTQWVNNWDLVDSSAPHILGAWLLNRERSVLDRLAASSVLWEQRIAVLATQTFIRKGDMRDTVRLCALMLNHPHDLMHKACGWMLREAGNKNPETLDAFLADHATQMPRTMLRYAIEKLTPQQRAKWMSKDKSH